MLYLSGPHEDAGLGHGGCEGETAFLQKPFAAQTLAQKVREVLDGASERRAR